MKHFTSDDRTVSREFNQTVHNSHAPRGRLECSRLFADAVEKNNAKYLITTTIHLLPSFALLDFFHATVPNINDAYTLLIQQQRF